MWYMCVYSVIYMILFYILHIRTMTTTARRFSPIFARARLCEIIRTRRYFVERWVSVEREDLSPGVRRGFVTYTRTTTWQRGAIISLDEPARVRLTTNASVAGSRDTARSDTRVHARAEWTVSLAPACPNDVPPDDMMLWKMSTKFRVWMRRAKARSGGDDDDVDAVMQRTRRGANRIITRTYYRCDIIVYEVPNIGCD